MAQLAYVSVHPKESKSIKKLGPWNANGSRQNCSGRTLQGPKFGFRIARLFLEPSTHIDERTDGQHVLFELTNLHI